MGASRRVRNRAGGSPRRPRATTATTTPRDGCTPSCRFFCTKPVTEILNLVDGGGVDAVRLVIDNQADWCAFRDQAHSNLPAPPPCDLSLVDFAAEIVFAGGLGVQPNDCHVATIGCAEQLGPDGDVRVVLVREQPGAGCSCGGVVVHPVAAAKVALPVAGTRIIYEETVVDCP